MFRKISEFFFYADEATDRRIANWLFVSSPIPTLSILALYFFVIYIAIPLFMKDREPVKFGKFLTIYNLLLVIFNYYIAHEALVGSYHAGYPFICVPLRKHSVDKNELKVTSAVWWYFLSKHIELLDTVILALRKQDRQITFLHVYHHAAMAILTWISIKWVPGGQSFFITSINSLMHVVMYTYYGLASLGTKLKKYLWWKKYLTTIQILQLCSLELYVAISLYKQCPGYPVWLHWLSLAHGMSLILLFLNFYYKAYMSRKFHTMDDANSVAKKAD